MGSGKDRHQRRRRDELTAVLYGIAAGCAVAALGFNLPDGPLLLIDGAALDVNLAGPATACCLAGVATLGAALLLE